MKRIVASFLIVILSYHFSLSMDLILTSSHETNLATTLIPCKDNTDCEIFQNGECKSGFCECDATKFCIDKIQTKVTKIGEVCNIDADCHIKDSRCKEKKCTCAEDRVVAFDERRCLKIAAALDSTCDENVQCYKKVQHSVCQNEKCVCEQQMHNYEGACYRDVVLGEKCQLTGECSKTTLAKCIDEKCACKIGYVPNKASNRCLNIATKNQDPCEEDIQCSTKLGKAFCKEGRCNCEELYQFKFTKSACVRDLLLGEVCENNTDCHGPEEGERRSECILGECKCKSEYREEHGFCTSGGIPCVHVPSVLLFVVLLICICFYDNEFVIWAGLGYSIFYMLWITFLGRYFTDNNNYMNDKNPRDE